MRVGEIKGEPVVSVASAERLGVVEDVYLDSAQHRVLGLRVRRGGLLPHHEAVLLGDVTSIGRDAVTLPDAGRLNQQDKFTELQGALLGGQVIGSRMMSENGHELGTIADLDVDFATGAVERYLLAGSVLERLRREEHGVAVNLVKSIGEKLVVVDNAAAAQQ
jgi:uncharacterized protein YrrD